MEILDLVAARCFGQDHHVGFDEALAEGRRLANEALHRRHVVLGEHRRHGIPFGAELKKGEVVEGGVLELLRREPGIDVRVFVLSGVEAGPEVGKGKALAVVELVQRAGDLRDRRRILRGRGLC